MALSLSAKVKETPVDLKVVNGDEDAVFDNIEYGQQLMRFAEGIVKGDREQLTKSRDDLETKAGQAVVVDAAAVAANFQRMVRIADSTGIPLDTMPAAISMDIRNDLDINRFHSGEKAPRDSLKMKVLSYIGRPLLTRIIKKSSAGH